MGTQSAAAAESWTRLSPALQFAPGGRGFSRALETQAWQKPRPPDCQPAKPAYESSLNEPNTVRKQVNLDTERQIQGRPLLFGELPVSIPAGSLDHARDVALTLLRTFADKPSYVLGVTSAVRGEGKTTISVALAEVMAADFGLETVLVDGNAERSWQPTGGDDMPGLSDWLVGAATLDQVLRRVHDKCSSLAFGHQPITSRDVLQYLTRNESLAELRAQFSLVILDLPDMLHPAAAALANLCDGLVLVVRSGDTTTDRVREALPLLQNVTIHGAVLNRHRSAVPESILRLFA